jgi:hypothetical protein
MCDHPKALQRYQLIGVVTALAELLPAADAPAAQPEEQQQQQQQLTRREQQARSRAAATRAKLQQELLQVLQQQLLPRWSQEFEVIRKSMGKGRQARYFQLKWDQLLDKCSMDDSSRAGSDPAPGAT